jgi:phosphatidylinositol-3-phosphatase
MKRYLLLLLAAPLVLLPAIPASAGTGSGAPVVLIVMENHSYGQIVGNRNARYLNDRFIPSGKLYSNYWAITHPSLPNYLALTSGTTSGCRTDTCRTAHFTTNNIFHQVDIAGMHWRAYQEGMPSKCAVHDSGRYLVRHNPPPYYRDLMERPCKVADVPYPGTLPSPLKAFTFVTPDACHDMHDCSVSAGDHWLRDHVPAFLNAGAIVVITFDEGVSSDRVMTAVSGPGITAGAQSHARFTHYGLLAGIEAHLGVRALHHAKDARRLRL